MEKYSYPTDLWSVGCIILELVLRETLKEALWPDARREVLELKIEAVTKQNQLLGKQASSLLLHDASKRINAFQLHAALRLVR